MNQEQIMQQLQGAVALHNQASLIRQRFASSAVDANNSRVLISLMYTACEKKL